MLERVVGALERVRPEDVDQVTGFLRQADLTLSGLDDPAVRLWAQRNIRGEIVGTTGYEVSDDGCHALIRSVAVASDQRAAGNGGRLARFALARVAEEGVTRAWLFSRRSGPFWQGLGFVVADRDELALVLERTHQVRMFRESGQLGREVAWSRCLAASDGGRVS